METCFNYTGDEMYVSSDERKIINKILKIYKENQKDMTILAYPEENDGCIYVKMPASWLRIKPPTKYSEERKLAMVERGRILAGMRNEKGLKTTDLC